jgi:hypothetical protein
MVKDHDFLHEQHSKHEQYKDTLEKKWNMKMAFLLGNS